MIFVIRRAHAARELLHYDSYTHLEVLRLLKNLTRSSKQRPPAPETFSQGMLLAKH